MLDAKLKQILSNQLKRLKLKIKKFSHWYIFPFEINSGAIANTETGYKPLNSKVTDYGNYELIFTGNSSIICIWKGSTKIYQKNKGENGIKQDQFYTKQYNLETAEKWQAYLIDDNSNVNFGSTPSNTIFKNLSIGRTRTLISFNEQIKVNDYLQFFVVLNDNNENIQGTDSNQDRQLMYISNITNKYDPYTNKFYCQIITLSSVNDRVSSSGMTLQSFLQYGAPGSGYAFPKFINKKLQFNKELMRNIGVRYTHRQFYGLEALCSISYFGRPIIQGEIPIQIEDKELYEQKVFASRRLFIAGNNQFSTTDIKNNGGLYAGLNDKITTNSHPETTFYNIMDAKPTGFKNYSDWQTFLASKQFNILAEKSFKGMFSFDANKAKLSNGTSTQDAKMFWDSEWNINNLEGIYNVEMSNNFKYKDSKTNLVIGASAVDYSKITQKWMSAILNFNSVVFSPIVQMPYDSEQWLPFSLSSIPLIGKMLNSLMLGVPVGFIITQNFQQYKKMLQFNAFMSAFFTSALDGIFGKNGLLPLNVFSTQNNFELGQMLGAKVSTTALLMKLTDRLSIYPWDPETGHRIENREQISSVDLSQQKNNKIYILDEESEFLDITSPLTNKDIETQWNPTEDGISDGHNYAFIIDYIVTQSLGQGEERHTFYSDNPYTYQGDSSEISIAQFKIKNQASFTDNIFNWTTQYKLNHDEYSETEETTFNYPAAILPPDPLNIAKPIEIPNLPQKIESNIDNIVLFTYNNSKLFWDPINWIANIGNKIKPLEVDFNLKDYLDPSLFITTLNDLKRFYKSITILLEWNYKTDEIIIGFGQDPALTGNKTIEDFKPSKSQSFSFSIDLNELNIYSEPKKLTFNTDFEMKLGTGLRDDAGVGLANVEPENTDYLYNIQQTHMESIIKNNIYNLKIENTKNTYLGFCVNGINFKIQLFPNIMKVESANVVRGGGFPINNLIRTYDYYNLEITKIVFNPR